MKKNGKKYISVNFFIIFFFTLILLLLALFYFKILKVNLNSILNPSFTQKIQPYSELNDFDKELKTINSISSLDFIDNTKNDLIRERKDFILADLAEMKIFLYKQGEKIIEEPILTKGRPGSWWETPTGVYKINSKEENHFSSFGHVWQPYSLSFQGNFFIHGWPYYEGGKPVSSSFSGGCIRLSDESAKKIYDQAQVNMPVIVTEKKNLSMSSSDNKQSQLESVSAESYLAVDMSNNLILLEKNKEKIFPIASITKLMSAIISTEFINLDKDTIIGNKDLVYTSISRLKAKQSVKIYDLLFLLLLESSNEAASALGNVIGKERFVSLMNEKAKAIGMKSTVFTDTSGSDAGNMSNAEDLFNLANYIVHNRSFIFKITSGELHEENTAYGKPNFIDLKNFNDLRYDKNKNNSEFIGGKVGQTSAAKETALSIIKLDSGKQLLIIVLRSDDRQKDTNLILESLK